MKTSICRALRRPALKHAFFLGVIALTLACSGCGNFFAGPPLTSISLGPQDPTIAVGRTQQMSATGVYEDNSRQPITNDSTWASSNPAVATVNSSGLVTGIAVGTATISAYDLGFSDSTSVMVTDANLVSISITPTSATISPGQSQQFTATGLLQSGDTVDLTNSVTWNSSNTSVATIDGYGLAISASVSSLSGTDITAQSGTITSNIATLTVE